MSLLLALLCAAVCAGPAPGEADRLLRQLEADRLTRDTQQAFLESGSHLIVFYYLEEVKPRPAFAKMYVKIKEKLAASWPQFRLGFIDAARDADLLEDLSLEELPLVQVVLHGIVLTFNSPDGSMNFNALPDFVNRVLGSRCPLLPAPGDPEPDPANFQAFFFSKGRPDADRLMDVLCAKYQDSANIFRVEDPVRMAEVAQSFGYEIEVADFLLLGHRTHDQQAFLFESRLQAGELLSFLDNAQYPVASHLTEKTVEWAVQDRLELLVFFFQDPELVQLQTELLKKWVQELNDASMLLCLANMNEDFVKDFVATHGIDNSVYSLFVVRPFVQGMPKYRFNANAISLETLSDFWAGYKSKSLKRFYKSEKPSDTPEAVGSVTTAVGSDFKQRVVDNDLHHCVVYFHDDSMLRLVEEFRAVAEEIRIQSIRFYLFNTQRNENAYVEPVFHRKVLLFRRLDDQVPELEVGGEMSSYLILEFLKDHLPDDLEVSQFGLERDL